VIEGLLKDDIEKKIVFFVDQVIEGLLKDDIEKKIVIFVDQGLNCFSR
jgi:hypothetical protein